MFIGPADELQWQWRDWIAVLSLFIATAAVVIWQNSRLGVLWDVSYILENSYRISAGDIPYRDFPFPYAPLTFLTQAALIKLAGRVFWHHIAYCAIGGGFATALTWRIVLRLVSNTVSQARLIAFLLTAPLIPLGIYCIFPHPFYDPDCTCVILICIYLLLRIERKGYPTLPTLVTGASLVVPLFVKQNTGLAFLGSAGLAIIALLLVELWNRRSVRGHVLLLGGSAIGLALALLIIHISAGLDNYRHWTIAFAAARRTPRLSEMVQVYQNHALKWWLIALVPATILLWLSRRGRRIFALLSALLMSLPFVWSVIYLFIDSDDSERAERLVDIWPFVIIAALFFGLLTARNRKGVALALPFVLICTVHGAFLSQQLWGSTFGIWPLLVLLMACVVASVFDLQQNEEVYPASGWTVVPLAVVVCVALTISGAHYVWSSERLDYVNPADGEMARTTLPALKGISLRGPWIPDFEELVAYSEKEIPHDDGILMVPGEDLFYYTTGRHPRFPVLMFDRTVNPFSPDEVLATARTREIRWLIVKQELQIEADPADVEYKRQLLNVLQQDFVQVESLNNYDIYRRKTGADTDEEHDNEPATEK